MAQRIFKSGFACLLLTVVCGLCFVNSTQADTLCAGTTIITATSEVVINEIQTNGVGTGTTDQEFVELKNIGDVAVDISGWKLRYISSSGNYSATPQYFITFADTTMVQPGGFILVTPASNTQLDILVDKITYGSSYNLAATGGSVALVNTTGVATDLIGWGGGSSTCRETELAPPPPNGQSIQRKIVDDQTVDTNDNSADFETLTIPTPQTDNTALVSDEDDDSSTPPPADDTTPPADEGSDTSEDTPIPASDPTPTYQPIYLNELFIDPASPLTDANDEFVELYNPNTTDQDMGGYTIYAGSTYAYHYTFPVGTIITAGSYISITSGGTSIALSNGGGKVKIVSPGGEVYDEVTYEKAKSGEAWAKTDLGNWVWTTTPTQYSANTITQAVAATVIAKAKTTAKTSTKKASTTSTKTTATKVKAAASNNDDPPALINAPSPLPVWLLATLGTLAVLYSGYEYRFDIANKFYQLNQYRADRSANRR